MLSNIGEPCTMIFLWNYPYYQKADIPDNLIWVIYVIEKIIEFQIISITSLICTD